MTLRDRVWDAVLKQILRTGHFRISELPFDSGQRHTVRRVLREMEQMGWLSRENDHAATWRMGEQAELFLNVSADKIKAAKA